MTSVLMTKLKLKREADIQDFKVYLASVEGRPVYSGYPLYLRIKGDDIRFAKSNECIEIMVYLNKMYKAANDLTQDN